MNLRFDNIVGISSRSAQVKETARRIAPTDITVLITGAPAPARSCSARRFIITPAAAIGLVAVDCSAIPEALMESELFGTPKDRSHRLAESGRTV